MRCPSCSHVNRFDSKFCSRCATRLSEHGAPVDFSALPPMPAHARSNATAVLVLGICSLAICGLLGPIAWVMGSKELARIRAGELPQSGYGMTNAGYICGIIGTILIPFTLLYLVIEFG
jgi:hypothetical protein